MNDCIFCSIAETTDHKHHVVWSDDSHVAFLTIGPVQKGHTLVIPKKHYEYAFSMPENEYVNLLSASRKVANGIQNVFQSERVMLGIEGFQVPHVHVHLIPVNKHGDAGNPTILKLSDEEMSSIGDKLKDGLQHI